MTERTTVPWESTPGNRGYFCVKDTEGTPLLQGEAEAGRREIHVTGDAPVVIDKMFGPLIFWPLRITASIETCEWVIERLYGEDNEWHEVTRIPGQLEADFTED